MTIPIHPSRILMCVAAPLLLVHGATSPARANDDERRSATVKMSDLDLNDADDRKLLDRRIRRAIRQVCPPQPGASPILIDRCAQQARKSAREGVRSRQLAAEAAKRSFPPQVQTTVTFDRLLTRRPIAER